LTEKVEGPHLDDNCVMRKRIWVRENREKTQRSGQTKLTRLHSKQFNLNEFTPFQVETDMRSKTISEGKQTRSGDISKTEKHIH